MLGVLKRAVEPIYQSKWLEPYHGVPTNLYYSKRADFDHDRVARTLEPRPDAPSHVLVVLVDALRPDFPPDIGLDVTTAVTTSTWTMPAVTSAFTGKYPHEHETIAHRYLDDEEFPIPEQAPAAGTLPTVLEAAGYDTYAGCSFFMPFLAVHGWFQSHRVYRDESAETVVGNYRQWRAGKDRTFGYLHLGDLHAPIETPDQYLRERDVDTSIPNLGTETEYTAEYDESDPAFRRYREHRFRLYRAALDYVEDVLAPLVEDCADDTLLVVTGDHGEAYWEHPDVDLQFSDSGPNNCLGHGSTPFDTVARVPLAVSGADVSLGEGWPSLVDVPATVARATVGREAVRRATGGESDFGGYAWQDGIPADRAAICEAPRYGVERKAVYRGDQKVIRSEVDDVTLTARVSESGETFCSLPDEVTRSLLAELPDRWDVFERRADVGDAVEDRLSALGYT